MKNKLHHIARIVVGCLLVLAGLVKANDPIGASLKVQHYLEALAQDMGSFFGWISSLSLVLAVVLSVSEILIGAALLVHWRMKITSWMLLTLMGLLTTLAFYAAYFDTVTDCHCYGDMIVLDRWPSFFAYAFIMVLIIPVFMHRMEAESRMKKAHANLVVSISTLVSLIIAITAIRYLPFVDVQSYAVGTHIPSAMQPTAPLQHDYIMEKDGKEVAFPSYPDDSSYRFVRMELKNPEAQPDITDFAVWNDEGDYTESILKGIKLLIIIPDAQKAKKKFDKINALVEDCESKGIEPWAITASSAADFEEFRHEVQLAIPYFFADITVLKKMIRSNPGLILLHDGKVMEKWHVNSTPTLEKVLKLLQ